MTESEDSSYWRDRIRSWCDEHGLYTLSLRLAFVPEEVLRQILFEPPEKADRILTKNGY